MGQLAGPQAKAHYLLKDLDLGHSGSTLRQAGQIMFEELGGSPGNSFTWVELRDDLTVSLLQARLIELHPLAKCRQSRVLRNRPPLPGIWDYCSPIETWMGLLGRRRQSIFAVSPPAPDVPGQPRMTLSHKGRYWQIFGLEKHMGLRAIIYISAPAGECSKGRFAHCSVVRGARSVPLFPTRPRMLKPSVWCEARLRGQGL